MAMKVGYPDLTDADFVFRALLRFGMFSNKLPPCFSSDDFYNKYVANNVCPSLNKDGYYFVSYEHKNHSFVSKVHGIPHPLPYWYLCSKIQEHWKEINEHSGKPDKKFSFCHVRKVGNGAVYHHNYGHMFGVTVKSDEEEEYDIYNINYKDPDEDEIILDSQMGCGYVVKADISKCYPSIYTHTIPWAIMGKGKGKKEYSSEWPNKLDEAVRYNKNGETNGILIGPHTSSIISEIILTTVDNELQQEKFHHVIRHIDDYLYFADDLPDAQRFLNVLKTCLANYELSLNPHKTKIIEFKDYDSLDWIQKLCQHQFLNKDNEEVKFDMINSYINYAHELARMESSHAPLTYAIKVIKNKNFSLQAKKLYVKKILSYAITYPYLLPLLEDYVFPIYDEKTVIADFSTKLFHRSILSASTDGIAFALFFACKYEFVIEMSTKNSGEYLIDNGEKAIDDIIKYNDCISMLMAFHYANRVETKYSKYWKEKIEATVRNINSWTTKKERDKYWLLLYDVLEPDEMEDEFLMGLKKSNVEFCSFS